MIQPGLLSITFRKLPPQEIVALVRQAQLTGIEWGGDIHVPPGDLTRAAEAARQTVDAGLQVSAYGSYYRVGQSEADGLPFEKVLETAVALGAPTIRVWAGRVGSAQADAKLRALVAQESRRIADLAAQQAVSVSYEYHENTLTDTNDSAGALLDEVKHPNLFTFWQPPNEGAFEYCLAGLRRILPRLSHVHVFHWGPARYERRPLADGAERWRQYLQVVQTTGRDHFASLEFVRDDSPAAFLEDAQTLRRWLADRTQ